MGLTDEEKSTLIDYRIEKAHEVYKEAVDVASMNHWNLCVNRLYYSVFHLSSAWLLSNNDNAKSHAGIMRMIMQRLVRPGILSKEEGELIVTLFNMRHTGDYDDLFDWSKSQVEELIVPTHQLLLKLEDLVNQNRE